MIQSTLFVTQNIVFINQMTQNTPFAACMATVERNHNICAWRSGSWVSSRWENIKRNVDPWLQLVSYGMMPLWTLDVTTSTSRTHCINSIDTIDLTHARYRRLWPTFAIIAKHNPLLPVIWSFVNKIQSNLSCNFVTLI